MFSSLHNIFLDYIKFTQDTAENYIPGTSIYIAASFIHLASLFVNINWVECKLSYWVRIEPELLRT